MNFYCAPASFWPSQLQKPLILLFLHWTRFVWICPSNPPTFYWADSIEWPVCTAVQEISLNIQTHVWLCVFKTTTQICKSLFQTCSKSFQREDVRLTLSCRWCPASSSHKSVCSALSDVFKRPPPPLQKPNHSSYTVVDQLCNLIVVFALVYGGDIPSHVATHGHLCSVWHFF